MQPPFPGPATVVQTPAENRGFYRSSPRVAVLMLLAPVSYELWWFWQLFRFTRREGFPRTRAFWWIFVPIYGWVVIYRQFDDLKRQLAQFPSPVAFSAVGAIWLVIISQTAGSASNRANGMAALVFFVLSGVLIAAAVFLTQNAANAYQDVRYPGRPRQGLTWGEALATLIGLLLFGLVILGSFLPA
jgi:hypothetical protein